MIQTAEGATKEVTNMLQRVRELAVQAANDTYDAADRTAMQDEVGQLEEEITRIATNTKWNGMSVLSSAQTKNLQVGMENATDSTIELNLQDMTASGLDVSGLDLSSHTAAQAVLDKVDTAIATVDSFRSDLGSR
jgi:flagellin